MTWLSSYPCQHNTSKNLQKINSATFTECCQILHPFIVEMTPPPIGTWLSTVEEISKKNTLWHGGYGICLFYLMKVCLCLDLERRTNTSYTVAVNRCEPLVSGFVPPPIPPFPHLFPFLLLFSLSLSFLTLLDLLNVPFSLSFYLCLRLPRVSEQDS